METEVACDNCAEAQLEVDAYKKVVGKLKRGEDAVNWVGHEIGLRRRIEELRDCIAGLKDQARIDRNAIGKLVREKERMILKAAKKNDGYMENLRAHEYGIKRWKDNFRRKEDDIKSLVSHWAIGWLVVRILKKHHKRVRENGN